MGKAINEKESMRLMKALEDIEPIEATQFVTSINPKKKLTNFWIISKTADVINCPMDWRTAAWIGLCLLSAAAEVSDLGIVKKYISDVSARLGRKLPELMVEIGESLEEVHDAVR